MGLQVIDIVIVVGYLVASLALGMYLERKASAGAEAFFLGGRKLPWWALGASGMASNTDISGTAIGVALIYTMGLRGFFIEIRGGVVLIMAVLLAFMGKWNRRSGVMTMSEWMTFRFGTGFGGQSARMVSALAILLGAVPIIAYFAKGLETFVGPLMPGLPAAAVSTGIIAIVLLYTSASGLIGVVWTDVFQGGLILLGVLYVCGLALMADPLPKEFVTSAPMTVEGATQFVPVAHTYDQWRLAAPLNQDVPGDWGQYNALFLFVIAIVIKEVINGASGSGGYMLQRYLAAKNEREAGLISFLWTLLLSFRWPLTVAFAVLGIHIGIQSGTPIANPEQVMPTVLEKLFPPGFKGAMVAVFLAAFMSTFSSFVNSSAAYWVQDLYVAFLKPNASEGEQVLHGRIASVGIVALGLLFSYSLTTISDVWSWLVGALGAGLAVPLFLRWYWWRFNGEGFAVGTLTGMLVAIVLPVLEGKKIIPPMTDMQEFILASVIVLVASVSAALLTPPTPEEVLQKFYGNTRPFGFWGPCRRTMDPTTLAAVRRDNRFEILSLFIAVPWQIVLFLLPMTLMIREWNQAAILGALLAVLSLGLYVCWYRQLSTEK